ncbi:hypothetical protein FJZ26_01450 [Candidatus Parvarchaeota archaeon]|nr:hypothetical protein [Candidatus Parvarchaeota archaeon]
MKLVVPGQLLSQKPLSQAYSFVENNQTFASVFSMQSEDGRLVPLKGPYEPMQEDLIVGIVVDVKFAGYVVRLNSPYTGFLSSRECETTFTRGDVIIGRLLSIDEVKNISIIEARKLSGGRVIMFPPVKVPRLIGKKNSMINMIRAAAGCDIAVGRNGIVWLSNSGNVELAIRSIEMISQQAHIPGLTDRVAAFLKEQTGKDVALEVPEPKDAPRNHARGFHKEGLKGREGEF